MSAANADAVTPRTNADTAASANFFVMFIESSYGMEHTVIICPHAHYVKL